MVPQIEFYGEVDLGSLRIEISIHAHDGYKVYFTAKDNDDRRVWRTPLTDAGGNIKIFRSLSDAITDAEKIIENSSGKQSLALSA
ncbi:MAG TPA: hypothetical protein VFT90_00530 [Chryseosolibacter sp.]|nr:hypothetical protein [Chryseosolibacter sp.]